jgi:hypothetical protein
VYEFRFLAVEMEGRIEYRGLGDSITKKIERFGLHLQNNYK